MLRDRSLIPLSHDHHHALALCVRVERAVNGAAESAVQSLARLVVSHYDAEMRSHFESEETIVFPALASFEDLRTVIVELLREHRNLEALVELLRSNPELQQLESFTTMLMQHVRKEERVLFEETQRILSREGLDRIGSELLAARQ